MELKDRLAGLVRALPPAQRVGIAVAIAVLIMAAVPFVGWVTSPSYAMLYSGLEDRELAQVTGELEAQGVPFTLDGSRVMVPRDQVHLVRANLAEAGISSTPTVPGYELLDSQALGVSDFRQRVDLQRAVEGELSRTLMAMDSLESATVRLVLPDDALFTELQTPASASVLVRPIGTLDQGQIEAITLLVSSAVEDLAPDQITVADTSGAVLHSPGDGSTGGVTDRQQRRTRDFESAMAADLTALLQRATDAPASVVIRASLNYDESEIQTETFDDDGVALREQTAQERYEGAGPVVGGTVGVDGGPQVTGGGEGTYEQTDATREFGVDRTTTRTVRAPGTVERLSVALVVDEASPLGDNELRELVSAAAGLDLERGDEVAISRVPTPAMPEALDVADGAGTVEMVQRGVALLVLLVVAVALFLMTRRKRDGGKVRVEKVVPAEIQPPAAALATEDLPIIDPGPTVQDEVAELVERQPEEIAALLRGWLADRRAGV